MKMTGFLVGLFVFATNVPISAQEGDYLLIDDFSSGLSAFETPWEGFTDRVMGGRSDISAGIVKQDDEAFMRMRGKVSLENNGGFIQVRLKFFERRGFFDASGYRGIRVKARGTGDNYYIHVRTSKTIFPWKYYSAPLLVSPGWVEIELPWTLFTGGDYGSVPGLTVDKLKSVAVVASKAEFDADIEVSEIGFYR